MRGYAFTFAAYYVTRRGIQLVQQLHIGVILLAERVPMQNNKTQAIILFDGVCNLCNSLVRFIIERDREGAFLFASLQSESALKLVRKFDLSVTDFDSIMLIEGSTYSIKSEAALRIAKRLRGIWSIFYIFIVLPKSWRDRMYDFVAQNRYRWFGKSDQCPALTSDMGHRFLN
jgi:predicted DCC family thiol-disulfide oxidoreductase YuxK